MTIGDESDPRAYVRLAALLRRQIAEGTLGPGMPTPSITTLSQQYGYARQTSAKALRVLVDEGLLVRIPGLGYYVKGTTEKSLVSAEKGEIMRARPRAWISDPMHPSDAERASRAASQYVVIKYSRFDDVLLVVLGAPFSAPAGYFEPSPVKASIEVNAYLDTQNQALADSVFQAIDDLAELLGYEGPHDELLESGSFFRRAKANLKQGLDSEEVQRYRAKLDQAIELIAFKERQARVDNAEAEAFAKVQASLNDIPSACLLIGSMLIVKYLDAQGAIVMVRQLSALELQTLERFPGIQRDPRNAIERLAAAMMAEEIVEESDP